MMKKKGKMETMIIIDEKWSLWIKIKKDLCTTLKKWNSIMDICEFFQPESWKLRKDVFRSWVSVNIRIKERNDWV